MLALDALDTAVDEFGRRLALVDEGWWGAATPCDEWNVHDLVAHVVGGNRFAALVLAGAPADRAIEQVMSQPQLGADPVASFESSATRQRGLFREAGGLDSTVSHPLGSMPASRFLDLRVLDLTVHAWDLAAALGTDRALPAGLVALVLDVASHQALGFGITPLGQVGEGATDQERLLDLTGRRFDPPTW